MSITAYLVRRFFDVVLRVQTYQNLAFLALSIPLGLIYFIFIFVGLLTGFNFRIVWVGILTLIAVFVFWNGFIAFDRWLVITLLRVDIPPLQPRKLTGMSFWQKIIATIMNPVTWYGFVYLLARFPLSILTLIILIKLLGFSLPFLTAPFYYVGSALQLVIRLPFHTSWIIGTLAEALLAGLFGVLSTLISLHFLNGLAWISGRYARAMLTFSFPPTEPTTLGATAQANQTQG